MVILGIDTSTEILNIAIVNRGEMLIEFKVNKIKTTHSTLLIPLLDNIFKTAGIKPNSINGIAVSIGPGSFTGLRIGLSTAKGLAFALSIPIVGINSLKSYAFGYLDLPGILCPLIKARKGEYYYALYTNKNENITILKNNNCKQWGEIKQELLSYEETVYIFGNGVSPVIREEKIEKYRNISNIFFIKNNNFVNATNVALLGEMEFLKGNSDSLYTLSPFYISKSSAEQNLNKKNNNYLKREET